MVFCMSQHSQKRKEQEVELTNVTGAGKVELTNVTGAGESTEQYLFCF